MKIQRNFFNFLKGRKNNNIKIESKSKDNIQDNKYSESSFLLDSSVMNGISGLGIPGFAKSPYSFFNSWSPAFQEWITLYQTQGIVKRLVDILAEEMTREWVTVEGEDANTIMNYMKLLDVQKKFTELMRLGVLLGGAVIVMMIDDGQDSLELPVDIENINTVKALTVFDRTQVIIYPGDFYSDFTADNAKFGEPEFYTIIASSNTSSGISGGVRVHESRILRFGGNTSLNSIVVSQGGWDLPMLQPCYHAIKNLETLSSVVAETLYELNIPVFKIKNLQAQARSSSGFDGLKARLNIINHHKSNDRAVVLDSDNECLERVSATTANFLDLQEMFARKLCAESGVPYAILFGDDRSGIVNGVNSDLHTWYDHIRQKQSQYIYPILKKLVSYIAVSEDSGFTGELESLEFTFNKLWQYEEKDLVAMELQTAQIDSIYIDRGVITNYEARARFEGNKFNYDLVLAPEEEVDYTTHNINIIEQQQDDTVKQTNDATADKPSNEQSEKETTETIKAASSDQPGKKLP